MIRKVIALSFLISVCLSAEFDKGKVQAQTTVSEELSKRNLTLQQARQLARQAGVNPDDPAQLTSFARSNGASEEQIQAWLQELGLANSGTAQSSGQVQDLRDTSVSSEDIIEAEPGAQLQLVPEASVPPIPVEDGLPFFGYSFFSNIPDAFRPANVGPVDDGYIIGPEDEMRLAIWGATEFQYELAVDAEGRIFIPTIGQVTVAGQTLKDLREYLKNRLSKSYSGLTRDPATIFMDVTLTRLRPIRVFVIGELENPGGYTFSSYSTLFNVLYGVGGPTVKGSLRNIQLIRNGKMVTTFDLYEFLLKGIDSGSIRLQNNDRIFIPPRKNTISIDGPILRPAIYELKKNENLQDLITFAGGLKPEAYGKRFQVNRIIPISERKDPSVARVVLDYNLEEVLSGNKPFNLIDGDEITIFDISDRLEEVAYIDGAVYQPGPFQIGGEVITVKDIILAADSLTGDAYLEKGELIRTNEDLTKTFISLNIVDILADVPQQNIVLQRLDRVKIFSRTEIENTYTVSLTGAISNPSEYEWKDSMSVFDLLFRGKGLFDPEQRDRIFLKRADLIRLNPDGRSTKIIPFSLEEALRNEGFGQELLQPFDRIRVYENTLELIDNKLVQVSGSVKNPGSYELSENMTLEDLIVVAGGFTEEAYLGDIEVSRLEKPEDLNSKSVQIFVPLIADEEQKNRFYEPLLMDKLMLEANKFKLRHRDQIFIRPNPRFKPQESVSITGEVLYPGSYVLLSENELLSNVIKRAGGFTPEGYPKGAKLIRNGNQLIIDIGKVINGRRYDDIELFPGDEIIVPRTPNTVAVRGNVGNEGLVKFKPGEKVSYYLERVGGMQRESERRVLLTQPDGTTYSVRRKGLFKKNPEVFDGATIVVQRKPVEEEREGLSPREFLQETTALLTGALTIILLVDRVFLNQ